MHITHCLKISYAANQHNYYQYWIEQKEKLKRIHEGSLIY